MAVQEPNVYAGLSVVAGALKKKRPKVFARVIGELLFWVGEDRLTFGSDYNIWTPKWQVEGFVDWQMPEDEAFTDYPRPTVATKKKVLGLNAAKLYGIDVPQECRLPETPQIPEQPGEQRKKVLGDKKHASLACCEAFLAQQVVIARTKITHLRFVLTSFDSFWRNVLLE